MSTAEQARLKVSELTRAHDYLAAYEYLKENKFGPDFAPGAWELLWQRVHDARISSLSRYVQEDLWAAGIRNAEIAVERARDAISENRPQDAVEAIEEIYGPHPKDAHAAELLAHALLSTDKERAISLFPENTGADLKRVLGRVDLYRAADQLQDALTVLDEAEQSFPDEPRLRARRARIAEALGDWDSALEVWKELADKRNAEAATARQFVIRMLLKFERMDEAVHECAKLIASDAPLADKVRAVALLNQDGLLVEILRTAASLAAGQVANSDWEDVCRFLIDRGDIGLAARLADLQLPVGFANLSALMATQFGDVSSPKGADPFSVAASIRSPDVQLPFSPTLRSSARAEFQSATQTNGTSPAKVLIVNATLAAGGAERQIIPLVQSLLANGIPAERIHVAIFSLAKERGHAHFAKSIQKLNVHLHDLSAYQLSLDALPPTVRVLVAGLPASLRRDVMALWPILLGVAPQVLHGWQDRSSVACGYLGSLLGVNRVVMTARNMKPQKRRVEERHYRPIFDLLKHENALQLVANSEQGAHDYEDWIGLSKGQVGVIRNGLDTGPHSQIAKTKINNQTKRASAKKRPLVIGGVFRLAANKRPLLWLRTIAALRNRLGQPMKVRLVGRGPYRAQVEMAAREFGIEDIEIIPRLSTAKELYGPLDCLLLMSRVEGTPNVLLEAQACGIPVMACDVGGVRGAVLKRGPGKGLIMPVDIEPEDAAQAIADYLPTAQLTGAEERSAFVEKNYSVARLAKDIREIYGPETCNRLAQRDTDAMSFE